MKDAPKNQAANIDSFSEVAFKDIFKLEEIQVLHILFSVAPDPIVPFKKKYGYI